jgi:thiol-disulfide isomerase/thioredoxin
VNNPWTGKEDKNIYPISLWYVFDPNEEMEAEVLRFSRRGWLEGQTTINGIGANILLAEATMDAKIDTADQWSLAPSAAPKELYDYRSSRSLNDHAWLNDDAYRIVEVHPSGRKIILEAFDPGMTRVEEAEKLDIYAADKKAAHSGEAVSFLHNYQDALAKAIAENKRLFLDFETTWCGPCKIMDQLVYTADDVVKATDQFIAVKIDGDDHPELTKRFDVKAYPTLILLSPDEEVIDRRVGYQSVKATTTFLGTLK